MSTDITVHSSTYQVEDRSWLIGTHGVDMTPGITLDIALFTKATHYPNGFIPSGTKLLKAGSGKYGPASATACDGVLFSSVRAVNTSTGNALASVGGAIFIHGLVNAAKIPGGVNAEQKATLTKISFV